MRSMLTLLFVLGALGCAAGGTGKPAHQAGGSAVAYHDVVNPQSGVTLPHVRLPERPEIEQKVNGRVDALAADLRCEEDVEDGWYEVNASVSYAAHDVFSVQITSSLYCGGAHPVNGEDSSLTFDLRSGESLRFRSLFADPARDEAGIVGAFVRQLAPEDLEGCEEMLVTEALLDHYFAYTVSSEGLRMRTSFPHVIAACNTTSTVPFGELRAFARAGGILERLADAEGR